MVQAIRSHSVENRCGECNSISYVAHKHVLGKEHRKKCTSRDGEFIHPNPCNEISLGDAVPDVLMNQAMDNLVLEKFVPGAVVSLSKLNPNWSSHADSIENQDFLVQKIDEENCTVTMSPVKNGKVADITAMFTAKELEQFTVTTTTQEEPLPQEDQILDHGPYVTVQGYYEQWE